MTGRAAGYCAGYPTPGVANPMGGRGLGFGRGRGFGRGFGGGFRGGRGPFGGLRAGWGAPYGMTAYGSGALPVPYGGTGVGPYAAGPTPQQELDALRGQSEYFESAMEDIQKRIEELEDEKSQK